MLFRIKTFPKTGLQGRPKNPIKEPHPELVYGQVVKEKKKGKLVSITHRIKCGAERFAKLGLKIVTSLLEKLNPTLREFFAPLVRKTPSFSKKRENLRKQTIFFQAFYNFSRPHMSLRERIPLAEKRFEQKWLHRTPAMAAGITDSVWTFRELLTWKIIHDP